jgi:predicted alpha/beta-hydrolase family hydrolase
MLFVQGSRDAFGAPAELQPIITQLEPAADLFVVEGGDHSFNFRKPPASSNRTSIAPFRIESKPGFG